MHQAARVLLVLCLSAPVACGVEPGEQALVSSENIEGDPSAAPVAEPSTSGRIGPAEYRFATQRLARAEIELEVPPGYDTSVLATKLIPVERAGQIGEESCRYGEAGQVQTCTAEEEYGLALALLDRPIARYRQSFDEANESGERLQASALAGVRGFSFTAQEDGAFVTYGFYPVDDRTLLLVRRFSYEDQHIRPEIQQVIDSMELPEQRR